VAIAYQHVRENPQVPSSVSNAVPPALDSIVMKALAKNPLNRYQTAAEMRADLQRALAGQPVEAESVMTDAQRTQFIAAAKPAPRPGVLTPTYDDDDDTSHHRGALIWTSVVLALLLVIGAAALYVLKKDNEPNSPVLYQVPTLAGLSPAAAIDTLRANHLVAAAGKPEGSNGPCSAGGESVVLKNPTKGQVCTQNPQAGKEVADGTTVSFTVYAGPADVLVQRVVGLSYSEAQKALASEGLAASRADIDSPTPAGQVVGQDPPANASVQPGTTVKLQVANGKVKLPDVTKLTEQQARMKLNQLGFTTITRSTAPVQQGFLVGQVMAVDPTPGIFYDPSTTITLTVAVKPICPTPTSPSISPSTSPSASGSPSTSTSTSSSAPSSSSPSSNPSCTPG
jgi:serine/threonine-protein kinase